MGLNKSIHNIHIYIYMIHISTIYIYDSVDIRHVSFSLSLYLSLLLRCFLPIQNSIGTTLTEYCWTLSTHWITINSFLWIYRADMVLILCTQPWQHRSNMLKFQMILQPSLGSSHTSASGIFLHCYAFAPAARRRPRSARRSLRKRERPSQQSMTMLHGLMEQGQCQGLGTWLNILRVPVSNSLSPCFGITSEMIGAWQSCGRNAFSFMGPHFIFPTTSVSKIWSQKWCPVLCQCDAC